MRLATRAVVLVAALAAVTPAAAREPYQRGVVLRGTVGFGAPWYGG